METTAICPVCDEPFTRVHSKGKPPRYCSRPCANRAPGRMTSEIRARIGRVEQANHRYRGGWVQRSSKGHEHFRILVPRTERSEHPTCSANGYMPRSHYVWNRSHPDDPVLPGQVIHHENEQSLDDRAENLVKLASQSPHAALHSRQRARSRRRDAAGRFV